MRSRDVPGSPELPPWLRLAGDGRLLLQIAVQPNAKVTTVVGLHDGALKLRVAAPPVEGAANAAIVAFIANILGLKQRQVTIARGETGRRKTVELPMSLDPSDVIARLSPPGSPLG